MDEGKKAVARSYYQRWSMLTAVAEPLVCVTIQPVNKLLRNVPISLDGGLITQRSKPINLQMVDPGYDAGALLINCIKKGKAAPSRLILERQRKKLFNYICYYTLLPIFFKPFYQ
jgi:hypothetical protein